MEFSIQEIINKELRRDEKDKKITSWHASGLGTCPTGRYLQRIGKERDELFDDKTLRLFDMGHKLESWVIELIGKNIESNVTFETQVRVEDKINNLSGYADMVLEKDNEKIVYEIKSRQSMAFWHMVRKGKGANEHHQMQLWAYLKNLNIKEGRLIYFSKDDMAVSEYPIFLNNKNLEKLVMDDLNMMNQALKKKLPPKPIEDKKAWQNKYCGYHKQCTTQKEYLKN